MRPSGNPHTPFTVHKARAKKRGIAWSLTFSEWLGIWAASGHWLHRDRKQGEYVMSRFGDIGPYSKTNVFIQLATDNVSDRKNKQSGLPKGVRQDVRCNRPSFYVRKYVGGVRRSVYGIATAEAARDIYEALGTEAA